MATASSRPSPAPARRITFCGSYNFENQTTKEYQEFTTPYAGLHQVIKPDGVYKSQMRFGMYRWHIMDPVRFKNDLKVTMQALGWQDGGPAGGRYLPLQDDIASVAFWYPDVADRAVPRAARSRLSGGELGSCGRSY